MSDTFVVADAHGRLDLVQGLIRKAGAERGPGRTIVQLGDLASCTAGSAKDDLACLRAAPDLFDVLLIGNHEYPYLWGPVFRGFWSDPEVEQVVFSLPYEAAYSDGEFLVTHAGLTNTWQRWNPVALEGADAAARWLNELWRGPDDWGIFDAISHRRGGNHRSGGILWADWSERKAAGIRQVVGHTPGDDVRTAGDPPHAHCIDLGAARGTNGDRIAGCWLRDGEVEVVIYDQHTTGGVS